MDPTSTHQEHALRLFQIFEKGTSDALEGVLALFSPEAKFYMWGPHKAPMNGHKEMREGFEGMFAQLKDFRYRVTNMAENGSILIIERVESFRFLEKHDVEVSLVSVSELGFGSKIVSWTDYKNFK
ncbi:hypothetical protein H2198_009251 [Neophaeococcomyces mojaviensis]|uniref:Uncharacterized protein n=1 Tax=Neophaeococcomyces mojaviensis TaxID=3383035 RepID=A0ACC2ZV54_9EURO|nr:hypothetical protein H2198_009251 [Knufia sp. JES_112]